MEEEDKGIKKGVEEARGGERGGKTDRCKIRNETGGEKRSQDGYMLVCDLYSALAKLLMSLRHNSSLCQPRSIWFFLTTRLPGGWCLYQALLFSHRGALSTGHPCEGREVHIEMCYNFLTPNFKSLYNICLINNCYDTICIFITCQDGNTMALVS